MSNVAVDLDGTVCDYWKPCYEVFKQANHGTKVTFNEFCMTPALDPKAYRELFEPQLSSLPVMPYAHEALEQIQQGGVSIHIITAREPWSYEITRAWLESHAIPYSTLTCCSTKRAKVARAMELGCVVAVDDHPQVANEMAFAGIRSVLIETSYNQLLPISPTVRRLHWPQVADYVLSYAFSSLPSWVVPRR